MAGATRLRWEAPIRSRLEPRRAAAAGALVLGLTLAAPWVGAEEPGALNLPGNPLEGRLLFEGKGCSQCHGIGGSGAGIAPELGEGRFAGSFLDLGAELWNHVPGMSVSFAAAGVPWPELSADEATQLMAFLYFIDYLGRPGSAPAGQVVFAAKGCAACHGADGSGRAPGPDLAELESFASPLDVGQRIWNHGPSMLESMREAGIPIPTFAPGELADLSAFLRRRAAPGPRQRMLLAPGDPNSGRVLFDAKGCSSCHGAHAAGGRSGPDLRDSDLHRSAETIAGTMWNHALAMNATMQERGIPWPSFSTAELADVVAFLYFLPFTDAAGDARRGAETFAERGCSDCHSGGRSAQPPAPDLSASEASASPAALVAAMWSHAPIMKEEILANGLPWPELRGDDLRNLLAFLQAGVAGAQNAPH
ncbi:MAG TPA: c-type cytochrome [Thermoanaerobaculia bacterium]|nr:c-type cytochrome [Thermoanaerobaculia bacterium]